MELNSKRENLAMPSFQRLSECAQDIEQLLYEYGNILAPKIVEYEVEQCMFPVEILNEIRSIYAHLYRASVSDTDENVVGNVTKARSHSKRAILDCYKYLCVTYDQRYHEFFKKYNYVDWHRSQLQEKVLSIDEKRSAAVKLLGDAKCKESTEGKSGLNNGTSLEYMSLYKEAYDTYISAMDGIYELEHMISDGRQIKTRKPVHLLLGSAIIGVVVGIIVGLLI